MEIRGRTRRNIGFRHRRSGDVRRFVMARPKKRRLACQAAPRNHTVTDLDLHLPLRHARLDAGGRIFRGKDCQTRTRLENVCFLCFDDSDGGKHEIGCLDMGFHRSFDPQHMRLFQNRPVGRFCDLDAKTSEPQNGMFDVLEFVSLLAA